MSFSASLSRRLDDTAELLRSHSGPVRIVSHYDPDGITAAAIVSKCVKRLGLRFQTSLTKKLDDRKLEKLKASTPEGYLIILTDMGGGKVSVLEDFPHKVLVIDHHQSDQEGESVIHLNPHLFGIDGAREASASSFSLALAITLDDGNWDLAPLAIAGAIGDRQNLGGFRGFNEELVTAALSREIVKEERMPLLRGETIFESLTEHPEPYFLGITGRKREASRLLKWLGLDRESKFSELEAEQRQFLASICVMRLLRQGATPEAVGEFVTSRYWAYDWDLYTDELSSMLNACARQGEHGLGLSLALGDKAARENASGLSSRHREWIINKLRELEAEPPKPMRHIQHFLTDETTYTGVLAGLGTLYFFDDSRATVGIARSNGGSHVSARAPGRLVRKGLNLGLACKLAAGNLGGAGGGHDVAAGATVSQKKEAKFLKELDGIVGEQLAGGAGAED